jgi:hypothetical protein
MYFEELIVTFPRFSVENRMLANYWDRLCYPLIQIKRDQIDRFNLNEIRGALLTLYHHLQLRSIEVDDKSSCEVLIYDLIMYQGDLERYGGLAESAAKLYRRAIALAPTFGRAYNQVGVVLSQNNHSAAVLNFLMSLVVQHPYKAARESLTIGLRHFSANKAPVAIAKVISMVLSERLLGRKQQHVRERAALLARRDVPTDTEIHLLWLTIMLEPGLLDLPDLCFPVEFLLKCLQVGITSASAWTLPVIHVILKGIPNFINRTKRFEALWTPIAESVAKFCNEHVGNSECFDNGDYLLPEDAEFVGIECFSILRQLDVEHAELTHVRASRLFAFAHGHWYNKTEGERMAKKRQTGALLARQKLQNEVDQLENQVQARAILDASPWYIPDFEYLLAHWTSEVSLSIENKSKRYLVTFAVLAELDYAKNGPSGSLARSIISRLAELSSSHDASVRLQRLSESIPSVGLKRAAGPKESHRRKFVEAVAYYGSNEPATYRVLSEDPETILITKTYISIG